MRISLRLLLILLFSTNYLFAGDSIVRIDKNIGLRKLTNHVYLVESSFSCNGDLNCNHLIVIDTKDLVLINTPAGDSLTRIMISSLEEKFKSKITKVIVSHFHDDSSGGLNETEKHGIKSFGSDKTQELLKSKNKKLDITFKDSMTISLQTFKLHLFYPGAGHSIDNIVTWIPSEKILFGGCLLKSLDADNIGNIKDADLKEWPKTVQKVKARFINARIVIPGHLSIGDSSLFDQTLKILKNN